jgi:hypothetical protein
MAGYFHEMVTHELGHNLGLRHNFKGNLGAVAGAHEAGEVSRSIMEYLGRSFRHLNRIGEYDLMAVAYGYTGVLPKNTHWFCTDEEVADLEDPAKSAECSRDDATLDPFSYYQSRIDRALDLLVARGRPSAPDWSVRELSGQVRSALVGLGTYAVSASSTAKDWTNFFDVPHRPTSAEEVKSYVLTSLKSALCDPRLAQEEASKESPEAAHKVQTNLSDLRKMVSEVLKPVFASNDLSCPILF